MISSERGSTELGKILVIHSNESLRRTPKLILARKGFATEVARTGAEALRRAAEEMFDIALLDTRLPDFKVAEFLNKLSTQSPDMDIIVITGRAIVSDAVESLGGSATDYIIKHLDMDNVSNTAAGYFEKKGLPRKKGEAEEALRESKQELRSLVSSMHDIVFVLDGRNRFIDYFCSNEDLLLLPPSEFLGKHVAEVLPPDVSKLYSDAMEKVRNLGESEIINYKIEIDGRDIWFSAKISLHENGTDIIASVKEITKRVEARRALETVEELYTATVETINDGILVVDDSGYPMYWNNRFAEVCSVNPTKMSVMSISDMFKEWKSLLKQPDEFIETLESINTTIERDSGILEFRDGRAFEWYTAPITKEENLIGRVWTLSEITQLKRAEEAAYLYLDLLGHDIRNHLQGMRIGVDMLESSEDEETTEAALNTLKESVRRISRLVDKVKSTEGLRNSRLRPRRLDHAVAKVIEQCKARFRDAEFEIQIETQEAIIAADQYLEYLIMNLIENAVQKNPNSTKRVWINLFEDINGFELSVSDNGTGLSDRRKEEMFDSSRRYGGIGLHQAKQIAEKYGGYVHVKDRVPTDHSKGAEFRVYFPSIDE
ncbi:MAG: PAS domain S-box protein [Promethearchaeati archaeon]